MALRPLPSSDDCDRDDGGQLHFAGVLNISVDLERFPAKLSLLMYDKLDEGAEVCQFIRKDLFIYPQFLAKVSL